MSERSRTLAQARTIRERWGRSEKGRAHAYIYLIREPRKLSDPKFFPLPGSLATPHPSFLIDPGRICSSRIPFNPPFPNRIVIT